MSLRYSLGMIIFVVALQLMESAVEGKLFEFVISVQYQDSSEESSQDTVREHGLHLFLGLAEKPNQTRKDDSPENPDEQQLDGPNTTDEVPKQLVGPKKSDKRPKQLIGPKKYDGIRKKRVDSPSLDKPEERVEAKSADKPEEPVQIKEFNSYPEIRPTPEPSYMRQGLSWLYKKTTDVASTVYDTVTTVTVPRMELHVDTDYVQAHFGIGNPEQKLFGMSPKYSYVSKTAAQNKEGEDGAKKNVATQKEELKR